MFLLDPEVCFLNHGSFGATPRVVFDVYQQWQRELERQPVEFLGRRLDDLLMQARVPLADFVGARPQDLAFVQNATTGVNVVARSLRLEPDDEVLATDLEYGACDLTWEHWCRRSGARYVRKSLDLADPVGSLLEAAGVARYAAGSRVPCFSMREAKSPPPSHPHDTIGDSSH